MKHYFVLANKFAPLRRNELGVGRVTQRQSASSVWAHMTDRKIYQQPSSVTAEDGDVLVKGPDDVDVGLSPDAAEETSNRLLEGSMKARGQRHMQSYPHRAK